MLLQGTVCDGSITGFNKGGVLVELDSELKGEEEDVGAGGATTVCEGREAG